MERLSSGIGREAQLVVGDQVEGAARGVARERLEVERLGHDPLAREGGVAVDQNRHHGHRVVPELARLAGRLVGPRPALDHRIHVLEVARVGGEGDGHAAAGFRRVGPGRSVVVLDVARASLGSGGVHRERPLALELREDRLVGPPDGVGEHVQASAVGHAEDDFTGARRGRQLDRLVEHRYEGVEPLDRELLLAEERLVEIGLERLHLGQPPQQLAPLRLIERLSVGARLDRLPQPDALLVLRDVLDLVGDRAGVGLAQAGKGVGEGVAGARHAKDRGRDAPHQLGREVDRRRVERGVARRL